MDYPDAAYSQPLRLTYSLHSKTMMESIQSCQRRLCYTDVQLISEGGIVFAHSIVLAGASNFLKHLLISNPDPTIVIHLPGVDYEPLRLLLEVLYGGEELQLTLKQVVALQDLGSLLHIDMCNSAAMEQAFLQASHEGVLSIPGSLQHSVDIIPYSNESSPAPTPQPSQQSELPTRRTPARSGSSPSKAGHHNNNNNTTTSGKKRKSGIQNSPAPMAPFSLLSNVTPNRASQGTKRSLNEDRMTDNGEELEKVALVQPPPKKLSRAALKEMVTCRECHTPFKLIIQLNQHMNREGHLFPPCPECGIIHSTLESLITHVDVHPAETVFTCKYCQKGVLGHDRYLYHMLMCKSLIRGDYVCFICRKSFRNSGSLKTHLLLHTGAKPFPCNYCSASFRQRHHRSHHERSVHLMQGLNNAEQLEATVAAAAADPEVPTTPQSVVDGARPFPCGFCNAAFRQSNHRSYHERVIHGVDRRTRQPKGGPMTQIPAIVGAEIAGSMKGANGGARKSISRPAVGNGFNSAVEAEDEEEIEDGEDAEDVDAEDADADVEEGDIVEEDGEAEVEADADGWVDEEAASPDPEAEDDEQEEEEEGGEEEEDDEEEAGSEIAADAASIASVGTKVDSEAEDVE